MTENFTTWYTSYRGCEVIFDVAPMLVEEQQRRLIGNDKVIIYFQEKTSFVIKSFRGNVNCILFKLFNQFTSITFQAIGIVVQPVEPPSKDPNARVSYKVGAFTRSRVKAFHPSIPSQPISDPVQLVDVIIASGNNSQQ